MNPPGDAPTPAPLPLPPDPAPPGQQPSPRVRTVSARPPVPFLRRVPLAVWIVLAVVAFHVAFFLLVADKGYLPETRHIPPAPTPNFGSRRSTVVDPRTGEVTTETEYVISTRLATPPPTPRPSATAAAEGQQAEGGR